ncbi:hypothetical protein [Streptomyces sp. NPDC054854]
MTSTFLSPAEATACEAAPGTATTANRTAAMGSVVGVGVTVILPSSP